MFNINFTVVIKSVGMMNVDRPQVKSLSFCKSEVSSNTKFDYHAYVITDPVINK